MKGKVLPLRISSVGWKQMGEQTLNKECENVILDAHTVFYECVWEGHYPGLGGSKERLPRVMNVFAGGSLEG